MNSPVRAVKERFEGVVVAGRVMAGEPLRSPDSFALTLGHIPALALEVEVPAFAGTGPALSVRLLHCVSGRPDVARVAELLVDGWAPTPTDRFRVVVGGAPRASNTWVEVELQGSQGAWAEVLVRAAGELASPFSPERLRRGRWAPLLRWLSERMSPVAFGAGGGDANRPLAWWWMRKGEEVPEAQGIPRILERWRAANRAGLRTLDWWERDMPTCEELLAALFSDPESDPVEGGDQRSRAGPLTAPHPLLRVRVPEPPRRIRLQVADPGAAGDPPFVATWKAGRRARERGWQVAGPLQGRGDFGGTLLAGELVQSLERQRFPGPWRFGINDPAIPANLAEDCSELQEPDALDWVLHRGTALAQLEDMTLELGADVVRHPQSVDLYWAALVPWEDNVPSSDPLSILEVYEGLTNTTRRLGGVVPVGRAEIASVVVTPENIERIETFLRYAHQVGIKVNLRLISGGGASDLRVDGSLLSLERWEDYSGEEDDDPAVQSPWKCGGHDLLLNIAPMLWSQDHVDHTVTAIVDGVPANYSFNYEPCSEGLGPHGTPSALAYDTWYRTSLDVASPYKRIHLGWIADAVGQLLVRAGQELAEEGILLDRVVEGIEIFNELSPLNQRQAVDADGTLKLDLPATARDWGLAWYECATGLWLAMRKLWQPEEGAQAILANPIRLWLPGLNSYGPGTGGALTWEGVRDFHRNMLCAILEEAAARSELDLVAAMLRGVDVHFYHRHQGEEIHIGFLVHELEQLRAEARAILDAWGVVLENPWGYETTVFETGTQAEEGGPPDFLPSGLEDRERYQAQEVWRRMCGALVGGASIAGWHTFMAMPTGDFAATGLRVDTQPLDALPDIDSSLPRLSWYAYQRLQELLRGWRTSARMLFPATSNREELQEMLEGADLFRDLVVFEFDTSASALHPRYVYVIFRDPTASDPDVRVSFSLEDGLEAQRVAPFPDSVEGPIDRGCSFPLHDQVNWQPDVTVTDTTSVYLDDVGTPVVLVADTALSFRFIAFLELEHFPWRIPAPSPS